jgi:hypothetical protein
MDVALMLPDLNALDPDALKALLIEQHEKYTATLTSRSGEIERLKLLVEKLQRMLFGTKSEKVMRQIEQLELQLEELQAASAIEENAAILPSKNAVAAKPFRRPLPEHLPREVHTHMPDSATCPDCGGKLRELGEDVAEMLEYVRACFKVIRHVRPKLSCKPALASFKHRLHRVPSIAASLGQDCWPMSSLQNMPITARSIGSRRSTLAKALISTAPRWPVGSEQPANCLRPWSMQCAIM